MFRSRLQANLRAASLAALSLTILGACQPSAGDSASPGESASVKTPAPSSGGSDPQALAVADRLLEAVGGRENWDNTRYITWVNHGKRLQVWDKQTGDLRVENRLTVVLMNMNTMEGRAWKWGEEITDPEALENVLEFGLEAFQLDSHEILLPFLLHDEGVHLEYLGEGTVEDRPVDILRVTFDEGAAYSRAEYRLHIDKESDLLIRWDYYMDAGDAKPRLWLPWSNYEKYGTILLSSSRGTKQHQDLHVFDELPASVFQSPEPVPWLLAKLEEQEDL